MTKVIWFFFNPPTWRRVWSCWHFCAIFSRYVLLRFFWVTAIKDSRLYDKLIDPMKRHVVESVSFSWLDCSLAYGMSSCGIHSNEPLNTSGKRHSVITSSAVVRGKTALWIYVSVVRAFSSAPRDDATIYTAGIHLLMNALHWADTVANTPRAH